jgi:fatty-acid desaturase
MTRCHRHGRRHKCIGHQWYVAGIGRIFLVLNSTFWINSVCHLWGSQPYSRSNSSRDSWWVSLITLGEGYHNYHHTFAGVADTVFPSRDLLFTNDASQARAFMTKED